MSTTENRDGTVVAKVGDHAISMTREFAAGPEKVFRAMHDPELVAQWIGPEQLEVTEVTGGTAHGDTWTLVHQDTEGNTYEFRGVVHGQPSAEAGSFRTFEWLGMPGHVSFERLTFTDLGGDRTRIEATAVYLSAEDRDGMYDTMGDGGYHRLDPLLAGL